MRFTDRLRQGLPSARTQSTDSASLGSAYFLAALKEANRLQKEEGNTVEHQLLRIAASMVDNHSKGSVLIQGDTNPNAWIHFQAALEKAALLQKEQCGTLQNHLLRIAAEIIADPAKDNALIHDAVVRGRQQGQTGTSR